MIRRVRLDENGALTEIDWQVTERAAKALLDYVNAADQGERARFDVSVAGRLLFGSLGIRDAGRL